MRCFWGRWGQAARDGDHYDRCFTHMPVIDVEIAAPAKHWRNEDDDDDDMLTKRGGGWGWRCVYEGRRKSRGRGQREEEE